jgi:toxin CcdB
MNQFDVCRNMGPGRSKVPYFVLVQSNYFSKLNRRVVIPLVLLKPSARDFDSTLMPSFMVEGREVFLMTADIFSIPAHKLGETVTSLFGDRNRIDDALTWLTHYVAP